jgi:hypothetical protein
MNPDNHTDFTLDSWVRMSDCDVALGPVMPVPMTMRTANII